MQSPPGKAARSEDVKKYIAILRTLDFWCTDLDVMERVVAHVAWVRLREVGSRAFNMEHMNKLMISKRGRRVQLTGKGVSEVTRIGLCSVWGRKVPLMMTSKTLPLTLRVRLQKKKKSEFKKYEVRPNPTIVKKSEYLIHPDLRTGRYLWLKHPTVTVEIRHDGIVSGVEVRDQGENVLKLNMSVIQSLT